MSQPFFQAEGVRVAYGKVQVVFGVDVKVGEGQIVTVIGPNGAGKTSLLKGLMGVIPSEGHITFRTGRIDRLSLEDRVASGIGLVPESRELFTSMSVSDNLALGGFASARRDGLDIEAERDKVYAMFPRLRERSSQRASSLSGGERQMLAIGRALMGRPRLLMLDEPSLGLAPLVVKDIFRQLLLLREQGLSILVVEQNVRVSLQAADFGYVMEQGQIVLQGTTHELRRNPRVLAAYLGASRDQPTTNPATA